MGRSEKEKGRGFRKGRRGERGGSGKERGKERAGEGSQEEATPRSFQEKLVSLKSPLAKGAGKGVICPYSGLQTTP